MKVAPEKLKSVLGIADVTFIPGRKSLAVVDATLSGEAPAFATVAGSAAQQRPARSGNRAPNEIGIDNFQFTPPTLEVKAGTRVAWVNDDDVPHLIASSTGKFKSSQVLDTGGRFELTLAKAGAYPYFCSLHPKMQGAIVVT